MNLPAYAKYLLNTMECNSENALRSLIQEDFQSFHNFNSVVSNIHDNAIAALEHGILTNEQFKMIDSSVQNHHRQMSSILTQLETKIL